MSSDLKTQKGRRQAVTIQMVGGYLDKAVIIIQGFLLIPLYLHFIGDRMYGLWLASGGILVWLGFMDMGLSGILIQRVSHAYGSKEYARAADFFYNGLLIFCILGFCFFALVMGLSFFIPGWFKAVGREASVLRICFQLAGVAATAEFMSNCLRGFSQALQRPLVPMMGMLLFRIVGLAVVILLLLRGYKLWSIPIGLMVTSIPSLAINGVYALILLRGLGGACKLRRAYLLDVARHSPALFASKLGSSMVAGIEPTLIALILKPEIVPVFVITRRAADMVHQLLSVIMASTFPGVAHLYADGDRDKFRDIVAAILTISFGGAVIGFSTYVAANQTFVDLWIGPGQSLGEVVTICMALGLLTLFMRQSLFLILIGMGDIKFASFLNLAEAIFRMALMTGLLYGVGLIGLPLGMLASCAVFGWVLWNRYCRKASKAPTRKRLMLSPVVLLSFVFAAGYAASLACTGVNTWGGFALYLTAALAVSTAIALLTIPHLKSECQVFLAPIFNR
jgi:O-antigen/teichoic acid export membrane protein